MKQKIHLAVYLLFMSILITGAIYAGSKHRGICPICKHSLVSEGYPYVPGITNAIK